MRWAGHVARMGGMRHACGGFSMGKIKGRRSLERVIGGVGGIIKVNLRNVGWGDVNWIHIQVCELLWTRWWNFGSQNVGEFSNSSGNISLSRRTLLYRVSVLSQVSHYFRPYIVQLTATGKVCGRRPKWRNLGTLLFSGTDWGKTYRISVRKTWLLPILY